MGISKIEEVAASQALAAHLMACIPPEAKIVAGYSPVRNEINVIPALEQLAVAGHTPCLPAVAAANAPLIFRKWQPKEAMELGMYGIPVPAISNTELTPDALLVPMLAFDAAGRRLGYGAGYYDRTIAALRARGRPLVIGVAYSQQRVDRVPAGEHDQTLDCIVTEKGVIHTA